MTDTIMTTTALPDVLFSIIKTEKVRVKENDGIIQILPIKEKSDCTIGLRGILVDCDNMSVDNFLQRKHADKELDL